MSQFDVISEKKYKVNQKKDGDLPENERNEEDEDMLEVPEQDETVDSFQSEEYPMKNGTILRKRKTQKIIRYVRFNKDQDPENFYREQLMLFYPWRFETKDLQGN